jgi:rare lipoprotein A
MLCGLSNNLGLGVFQQTKTLACSTVICSMAFFITHAEARIRDQQLTIVPTGDLPGEKLTPETPVVETAPQAATNDQGIGHALQSGMASWYGPGFHGRRTASGEVFNQNDMTAAHPSLPFGTRIRVFNQTSGQSVVVRINDRGPHARGRIIDLSRASARALGIGGAARVRLVSLN